MQISEVLVGSDVEFFLKDKSSGEIVSAEGIIRGTKTNPFKFDKGNSYYATSLDNILSEGNVPPSNNAEDFVNSIFYLRNHIDSVADTRNLVTEAIGAARLDYKHLQTPNSRIFGCDPALNCWTLESMAPQPTGDNLRSAGFHIHVGYKEPSQARNVAIAKALDLYLGVPSVLIEPPSERKAVGYGLAGNFRNQVHGCEYRTLSSYFASSRELIEWCFNQTLAAIKAINEGMLKGLNDYASLIQNTINQEVKTTARMLLEMFEITTPELVF